MGRLNNEKYSILSLVIIIVLILFPMKRTYANNVSINNLSYNNTTYELTFELSWDNSWRRDAAIPYNYDGIWVFVKVRKCIEKELGSPSGYTHAWLSTAPGDHSVSNSSPNGEVMVVEVDTTEINGTGRGMGAFIYRSATGGTGSITTSVTLTWDKAAQAAEMSEIEVLEEYDVNVYAIEMVYIPQASFYTGDGSNYGNCFYDYNAGTAAAYEITSENAIPVSGTYFRALNDGSSSDFINADFPKGYDDFWIMKYEISQSQYAEFLNTLTIDQAESRTEDELYTIVGKRYVMSNAANIAFRQSIAIIPSGDKVNDRFGVDYDNDGNVNETTDGGGIACNYLSLRDVLAYLDWAALRPLTEFEYEKACRGTIPPIAYENAWGTDEETAVAGIASAGRPNELALNTGNGLCNYGNINGGPMRTGYAATASTTRITAGSGYYGVLDMSGNVLEPYVSFWNDISYSDEFSGQNGDGELDEDGYNDVGGWPSYVSDHDFNKMIPKGGAWVWDQTWLRISRRQNPNNYYTNNTDTRNQYLGGRGGR